jgi:hypothetical protein
MFNTISGEDYQLVQIEVFFYRFEHQRYRDLPAATIGEFEFCSQNLSVSDDSHDKQSQFSSQQTESVIFAVLGFFAA